MKRFINKKAISVLSLALAVMVTGCKKFLDVVPDNIATVDNAFTMKREAEKYLFTCYNYIPVENDPVWSIGFVGGDECWLPVTTTMALYEKTTWDIAKGLQNKVEPIRNMWDGALYNGIRDCNIFLENVSNPNKVSDLDQDTRKRWLGEVEFLKAYYHFYLFRSYGPIAIVDKNLPISATPDEVRVKRMPVDSVVNYISNLLDNAAEKLPSVVASASTELGRVTKPAALALKARLWLTAASPLFNGNADYANYKDKDGVALFPANFDVAKWQKAAIAAKAAIDAAEAAGAKLYRFTGLNTMSDTTRTQMNIRNAVCERWNPEQIWSLANNVSLNSPAPWGLQAFCMGQIDPTKPINLAARNQLCAPLKIAQLFYTNHGVSINEDKTYDFSSFTTLRVAQKAERFNLIEGYTTARLNFDREPRFYADLSFDGGIWYMQNSPTNSDEGTFNVKAKKGQIMNEPNGDQINQTGYWIKKLVNWKWAFEGTVNGATTESYPWPVFRLADLYLMYAEAQNEVAGPSADVYQYLDLIRDRAGLKGVIESWRDYSINPGKPGTKEGLRAIIRQERLIELAFEGSRFWDLRRWKEAINELNKPITGWDRTQAAAADYYRVVRISDQRFIAPRDYFWPIREYNLQVNPRLVQTYGW